MVRYGFIEDGYLRSFDLTPYTTSYKESDGKIKTRTVSVEEQVENSKAKGWKPVEDIDETQMTCEKGYVVIPEPIDDGEKITYTYTKLKDEKYFANKIADLKQQLTDSDYKVIKCYEASLTGEEQPYDIKELHTKRQSLRQQINELQEKLAGEEK